MTSISDINDVSLTPFFSCLRSERFLGWAPVKDERGERIVVWANAVAEARYFLTVPEQRLILWLAAQIEREDDALKDWTISVQEMLAFTRCTDGGTAYDRFELAVKRLQTRLLELQLDDRGTIRRINWLHHGDYNRGQGTIT